MAQHGGHRTPAHPAPVSGPGALSKRTDGGPSDNHQAISAIHDQPYGDAKAQKDSEKVAPLAGATPMPAPSAAPAPSRPPFQGGDFHAPTSRPDEPVTAGAPIGPGPGPEALNFQPVGPEAGTGRIAAMLQALSATDTTGTLGQLYQAALTRGV